MSPSVRKKNTREIHNSNLDRSVPELMSNLVLWLHNIRSMHNVGSAFRTADAFGINSLLLSGYTPVPPRPEISKTALGAEENVHWMHKPDALKALEWCRNNNYTLAGLEQTHQSKLLSAFHPDRKTRLCLLFGNEVTGIDPYLLEEADHLLEIPQYGQKHSFNISVSIGITLYHFLTICLPE